MKGRNGSAKRLIYWVHIGTDKSMAYTFSNQLIKKKKQHFFFSSFCHLRLSSVVILVEHIYMLTYFKSLYLWAEGNKKKAADSHTEKKNN